MTGKELIIYILKNNLENEEMFEKGHFKFLMSEEEAARAFGVGIETVKLWHSMGFMPGVEIGDSVYFPRYIKDPREERKQR